ncbi:MAG: peptide deformylase [Ignavibacteriales bacterium]|nr:peptide deformylase [Ignavibacteriales bacterium]
MSVLPIYLYGTKVLLEIAKPVYDLDDATVRLVVDMFETMHNANGIGLAATQVGVKKRVIVIDISDVDETKKEEDGSEPQAGVPSGKEPKPKTSPDLPRTLTLVNPEILENEGGWKMEEGCLSIPEVKGEVERPERVRIRYRASDFKEQELTVDGLLARVIQHEIDHLNGVLFIDHASKARRSLMSNALRKIKKGEVETSYPVVTSAEE